MQRNWSSLMMVIGAVGNVALVTGDIIRQVGLSSIGGIVSDVFRSFVVLLIVFALLRSKAAIPAEFQNSTEAGAVGVLVVNALAYLGELIAKSR